MFDMEQLYWLNRHDIKKSQPERIEKLAEPYFIKAGLLPENLDGQTRPWFAKVVALLAPSVNKLDELPERAGLIFRVDAAGALSSPDNAEVLVVPRRAKCSRRLPSKSSDVSPMTRSAKAIMNEAGAKTG
jgi:hypothetical protein